MITRCTTITSSTRKIKLLRPLSSRFAQSRLVAIRAGSVRSSEFAESSWRIASADSVYAQNTFLWRQSRLPLLSLQTSSFSSTSGSRLWRPSYWQENLAKHILVDHRGVVGDDGKPKWSSADWKRIKQVYRLGRTRVLRDVISIDDVKGGFELLDRIAEERNRSFKHDGKADRPVVLDDHWLFRAWRDLSLHEINTKKSSALLSSEEVTLRFQEYLKTNTFAWYPQVVMWILDVWQAEKGYEAKPSPKQAIDLVEQSTNNYSNSRPIDKYVLSNLLKIMGNNVDDENVPDQSNSLVEKFETYAAQYPNDKNFQLDMYIYSAWIHVWAESGRKDRSLEALRILKRAQQQNMAEFSLFSTVLHALCRSGSHADLVQAHVLWQELLALDMPVTAASWTPLLLAHVKRQEWRAIALLWREAEGHHKRKIRPHAVARDILLYALKNNVRHWKDFVGQIPDSLPAYADWDKVGRDWNTFMQNLRLSPSHMSLAKLLLYLDHFCFAAVIRKPSWVIPASDMDEVVGIWRRVNRDPSEKTRVSLNAMLRRLRKYQGLGLLRPGSLTLDWMIEGVEHISPSTEEAALVAEDLLDIAEEDCDHDVNHVDFFDKTPVTRLMQMLSTTPEAPQVAELLYERLLHWYSQSGGRRDLEPDENIFTALIKAWSLSETTSAQEAGRRALELYEVCWENAQRDNTVPSKMFSYHVTKALAEAGDVHETEKMVTKVIGLCYSGALKLRNDLDFVSLLVLSSCRAGNTPKATRDLELMEAQFQDAGEYAFRPNSLSYNILLASCAEFGEIDSALMVLDRMLELHMSEPQRGIVPTVDAWNAFLNGLAKAESAEAAETAVLLLEKIKAYKKHFSQTVEVNTVLFNSILECFSSAPNCRKFVVRAEPLVRQMEEEGGRIQPNEDTYDVLLRLLVNAKLPGKAEQLLQRICRLAETKSSNVAIGTRHFNTVIIGFLAFGDERAFETVFGILKLMQDLSEKTGWDVLPNFDTFREIIRQARLARNPDAAHQAIDLFSDLCASKAASSERSIELFVDAISCWADSGRPEAGERILELARQAPNREMTKETEYNRTLLSAFTKCGLTNRAEELSEAMKDGLVGQEPTLPVSLEHSTDALEICIDANDFVRATEITDKIVHIMKRGPNVPRITDLVSRAVQTWKRSRFAGAGPQSERILQAYIEMQQVLQQDYPADSIPLFSGVILSYLDSHDDRIVDATDRLVRLYKETNKQNHMNLDFLETAVSVHYEHVHDESHNRIVTLLDELNPIEMLSPGFLHTCNRISAGIEKSNIKEKHLVLRKLTKILSDHVHKDAIMETPVAPAVS